MRIGSYLDLRNPPPWRRPWHQFYGATLELVEELERLGAPSVWLSEHHQFEDGYLPQPLTFAAAIAARTKRIRIGTAVLLLPLRSPMQVAEDAALVDIISGGRLDLGLGVGYRIPEYEAFGVDMSQRYQLYEDGVRELRRLWAGVATPPPLQDPIPLWAGFLGPRGARIAGRLGLGLLLAGALTSGELPPEVDAAYRAGCEEGGHDRTALRLKTPWTAVISTDPESAWARIKPHLEYRWNSYIRYGLEGTDQPLPLPVDGETYRKAGPNGEPPEFDVLTPDEAIRSLQHLVRLMKVDEVLVMTDTAGMPEDLVQEHIRLLYGEVAPAVADL